MLLYIDESGNPGKKEKCMVIAGVYFAKPKKAKRIAKKYCIDNGLCEIKASEMGFVDRVNFINTLNKKLDYEVHYVVLDKTAIYKKELFKRKNILYNYMCKVFLADIFMDQGDNVHLCFDNRTVKPTSLHSLGDYLKLEAYANLGMTGQLEVKFLDSKSSYNIQIADVVANTIYQHYEKNKSHCFGLLNIVREVRFPQSAFLN